MQELAALNARLQTGLPNVLDEVIAAATPDPDLAHWEKTRRFRTTSCASVSSVAVRSRAPSGGENLLITKGALDPVLSICTAVHGDGALLDADHRAALLDRAARWGDEGYRVLGVATRHVEARPKYTAADEVKM